MTRKLAMLTVAVVAFAAPVATKAAPPSDTSSPPATFGPGSPGWVNLPPIRQGDFDARRWAIEQKYQTAITGVARPSYTEAPEWQVKWSRPNGEFPAQCTLIGMLSNVDSPLWLSFRFDRRDGVTLFLGGKFHAKPGPVAITLTTDAVEPGEWILDGVASLNATTASLPDKDDGLLVSLGHAHTLNVTANGADYHLGLKNWEGAYSKWIACSNELPSLYEFVPKQ